MNRAIPIIASLPLAVTMAADAGQLLHDGSWTYLFGNHLDTHQESRLKKDGTLKGRLYIIFTEDKDPESGLPIARHPRGAGQGEECGVDPIDCVVGWNFTAGPGSAKFLYHQGVNGNDHPVWMVNRVDILNPGVFNHFHWLADGNSENVVVSEECDKINASGLENEDPPATNQYCEGWFVELRAIREFAFEHGGEVTPVSPGMDSSTHMNIVTNYEAITDTEVTATRGGGSH